MPRTLPPSLPLYYGKPFRSKDLPLNKYITREELRENIITAMGGNETEFYEGIQYNFLIKNSSLSNIYNYEDLMEDYARTQIKNLLFRTNLYNPPYLSMVEEFVKEFMKYNKANPPRDVFIPPHLTMPPIPPIQYEPEAPKKTVLRRIMETINNLKRKEDVDDDILYDLPMKLGGKSKKSKKQQRKTKAKKTHRKRTQRK